MEKSRKDLSKIDPITSCTWRGDRIPLGYLANTIISKSDVHYGPFVPGESELLIFGGKEWIKGKEVLDLGCGSANNLIACASWGAKRCVGLDISEYMLSEATELIPLELSDKIKTTLVDAKKGINIFPNRQFDLILAVNSLGFICENEEQLSEFFHEISLKLADDGKFVFSLPCPEQYYEGLKRAISAPVETPFDPNLIKELLLKFGFEIARIEIQTSVDNLVEMTTAEKMKFPYIVLNISEEATWAYVDPHTTIYSTKKIPFPAFNVATIGYKPEAD